jgi:hypothetical protein
MASGSTPGPLKVHVMNPPIQVFPTADELATNLLRFHLRFDQAIDVFNVNEQLRLVEFDGASQRVVEHPFLDFPDGLWSADGLTLTVLLHPGRIKTGLASQVLLAGALRSAHRYEFQGRGLFMPERDMSHGDEWATLKQFQTIAPQSQLMDAETIGLRMLPGKAHSQLLIGFGRSVDRLALENALALVHDDTGPVGYELSLNGPDDEVALSPHTSWRDGNYTIHFADDFEDTSGNRFGQAFESPSTQAQVTTSRQLRFSLLDGHLRANAPHSKAV